MTCKDKFYEQFGKDPANYDHRNFCPIECGYLPNPEYCKEGADEEVVCEQCWGREIPEKPNKNKNVPDHMKFVNDICDMHRELRRNGFSHDEAFQIIKLWWAGC